MKKKIIDLYHYRQAKIHYQKILEVNPNPPLTFKDYFRLRQFIEQLNKTKKRKDSESKVSR